MFSDLKNKQKPIIKCIFGNNDMLKRYMKFLKDPSILLPPFLPVLYRSYAYSPDDIETIIKNEYSHHKSKNKFVLNELTTQYKIYDQIKYKETVKYVYV